MLPAIGAAFPEAANNRVKVLRQMFTWACSPEYGYAEKNPARDVARLRSANPDGIPAWTEEDAARFSAEGEAVRVTHPMSLEVLHDFVKAGKARYIGASSMHAWQFARALGIAEKHGWTRFVSMQNLVNLLYREEVRERYRPGAVFAGARTPAARDGDGGPD